LGLNIVYLQAKGRLRLSTAHWRISTGIVPFVTKMVNNKNSEAFSEYQEAKRLKLLARSQKLEQKGQKLLAKAKAAAAKYEKLTIQKENAEVRGSVHRSIFDTESFQAL
jgi:hypothetical protein